MDLLQFAIDMEQDGEKYYLRQAKNNASNPLGVVFQLLADEEAKHAQLLHNLAEGEAVAYEHSTAASSEGNPFQHATDAVKASQPMPEQAELYQMAIEMERKSVDLYTRLHTETQDSATEALFAFLIREENHHLEIMEDLYQYVNRPNNWVEAAEFGVREEY